MELTKFPNLKIIKGDLVELALNGHFEVIVHGCNCFNTMGAGIAKQIKNTFPQAFKADQQTNKGDRSKLGTYTSANCGNVIVVNAYTQYGYWERRDLFEYAAFETILKSLANIYQAKKIGFPLIGCGLAGGNREIILGMINEILAPVAEVTVVEFN